MVTASRLPEEILESVSYSSETMSLRGKRIEVLPANAFMDFPNLTVSLSLLWYDS